MTRSSTRAASTPSAWRGKAWRSPTESMPTWCTASSCSAACSTRPTPRSPSAAKSCADAGSWWCVPLPSDPVWRILFHFVITVVLVAAGVGVAVGIGLITSSARTLRFFQVMNRWVSTRGAFKALDVPRSTEQFSHRHRRWVGWALIGGGIFATLGLLAGFNAAAVGAVFAKGGTAHVLAIAAESLRWFLLAGSIAGVVIGAMLCFFPGALATLERYA